MAKPKYSHLSLSLLLFITIITSSPPSLASRLSNFPSSRWTPRFLGKFSSSSPPKQPQPPKRQQQQPQIRYETRYFAQRLDHFSFSDSPRFQQRYLINTEHWVGPERLGPIFFYCGNEGGIEWFAENTGFVWEVAPQFGAMILFPEVSLCLVPKKITKEKEVKDQKLICFLNLAAPVLWRVHAVWE